MKKPDNRPDPKDLLVEFLASNRSEAAFKTLVENLSGLVYSSAYRRTENPQLAEEIAQNVFAILARKAESLQRHPCLTAWILETTRLESSVAVRSEKRRRRKLAALASETNTQVAMSSYQADQDVTWKDAVPMLDDALDRLSQKDRQAICQRFYEGRKFHEMATQNGQSEAACKMRVKRALDKISKFFAGRGVTLSTTVVASALGTEFARSAPAHAVTAMASNALAASSSIPITGIIANTFQTMSTSKTITAAAATVVALTTVPFVQQRAEASRLESELSTLEVQPQAPSRLTAIRKRDAPAERVARARKAYAARNLLASLDEPMEPRAFLTSLMSKANGDVVRESLAYARVARMSATEYAELMVALREYPCSDHTKDKVRSKLREYAPAMTPRERVETMIADGSAGFSSSPMLEWVKEEPDAAVAWYQEQMESGGIFGSGLRLEVQTEIFRDLLLGIAPTRPELALEMFAASQPSDSDGNTILSLTRGLAGRMIETGEDSYTLALMELLGEKHRQSIINNTAESFANARRFDDGLAFLERFDPDPAGRADRINRLATGGHFVNLFPGLDWAVTATPATEVPEVFTKLGQGASYRGVDFQVWIDRQPPGAIRDYSYAGMINAKMKNSDFEESYSAARAIGDPELRRTNLEKVARGWLAEDEAAAKETLPAELIINTLLSDDQS